MVFIDYKINCTDKIIKISHDFRALNKGRKLDTCHVVFVQVYDNAFEKHCVEELVNV